MRKLFPKHGEPLTFFRSVYFYALCLYGEVFDFWKFFNTFKIQTITTLYMSHSNYLYSYCISESYIALVFTIAYKTRLFKIGYKQVIFNTGIVPFI